MEKTAYKVVKQTKILHKNSMASSKCYGNIYAKNHSGVRLHRWPTETVLHT